MAERAREGMIVGSGNVFEDLGFGEESAELLVKADLTIRLGEVVWAMRITQAKAAELMGLDQPKVSALLQGQTRGYSIERLMALLARLGQDVDIVVRPKPDSEARSARIAVLAAS